MRENPQKIFGTYINYNLSKNPKVHVGNAQD